SIAWLTADWFGYWIVFRDSFLSTAVTSGDEPTTPNARLCTLNRCTEPMRLAESPHARINTTTSPAIPFLTAPGARRLQSRHQMSSLWSRAPEPQRYQAHPP